MTRTLPTAAQSSTHGTTIMLAGVPYLIKTGDGRTVEGETDAQGRTGVVWTDSPLPLQVIARPKPMGGDDPYHVPEWRSEDI